jgi:hypothetical protein
MISGFAGQGAALEIEALPQAGEEATQRALQGIGDVPLVIARPMAVEALLKHGKGHEALPVVEQLLAFKYELRHCFPHMARDGRLRVEKAAQGAARNEGSQEDDLHH